MGFFEEYWLEMLSITFSVIALFVSLYSLYLKRLDIEKERLAREITFGPVDEVIDIDRTAIDNRDEIPLMLVNDTGIPQIVNGMWIQIEQYPKDISDEQYDRFKAFMVALTEAGLSTIGQGSVEDLLAERMERRIVGDRTIFLVALMILIVNRIRQDDAGEVVVDQELARTLKVTSDNLDEIAEVLKNPENDWMVRKLMTPQVIEMLEDHIRPVMSKNGYPLYRSMKMEVPPEEVKEIDLHLMGFAQRLYDRLDLIGGEFDLLCRLHADVHKGDTMSRSEPFTLRLIVEPVDMGTVMGAVQDDLERLAKG